MSAFDGSGRPRKRSRSPDDDGLGLVSPDMQPSGVKSPRAEGAAAAGEGSGGGPPPPPGLPLPTLAGGLAAPSSSASTPLQSAPRPKPRPFRVRTRADDWEAYGREFDGCSRSSSYLVEGDLGVGTFGVVTKATKRDSSEAKVALKRIIVHNETDGVPITTIREIKLLKALKHENIVEVVDMVFEEATAQSKHGTILMVFPYMDYDLSGLLDNTSVNWTGGVIKLYAKQLIKGTAYLHRNNMIHRDLKAANILISHTGVLKIADFGLARSILGGLTRANQEPGTPEYTNMVVTRWYRPPELFLRFPKYGTSIDIWGIGCILGEMVTKRPILQGNTDQEQLQRIWELCGLPTQQSFPDWDQHGGCPDNPDDQKQMPGQLMVPPEHLVQRLGWSRHVYADFSKLNTQYGDLIDKCLTLDPAKRPTADELLRHEYFSTLPPPAKIGTLPKYPPSHEAGRKNNRQVPQRLLCGGMPIPPVYAPVPKRMQFDPMRQAGGETPNGGPGGDGGGPPNSQPMPPASFNPHLPVPTLHAQAPQPVPNGLPPPTQGGQGPGGLFANGGGGGVGPPGVYMGDPQMQHMQAMQQAQAMQVMGGGGNFPPQGPPFPMQQQQQQQPFYPQQPPQVGYPQPPGFRPPPPHSQGLPYGDGGPPFNPQQQLSRGALARKAGAFRAKSTMTTGPPPGMKLGGRGGGGPPGGFLPGMGEDAPFAAAARGQAPPAFRPQQGNYARPGMPLQPPPPPPSAAQGMMNMGRSFDASRR